MNHPFYEFRILADVKQFDFISIGKSIILKTIRFQATDIDNFYNLVLADIYDDEINVFSISDNGDMKKILETIIKASMLFFAEYPNSFVGFTGSTASRTRLYRIAIASEFESLKTIYQIFGVIDNNLIKFELNQNYTAFVFTLNN